MAANGISRLQYKKDRQTAKLALAATDRTASGRRATLDITQLPTVYATNDNLTQDVVNNANTGGLVVGRPWVSTPPLPATYYYISANNTSSYPGSGTAVTDLSSNAWANTTLMRSVGYTSPGWTFDGSTSNKYIDTNQTLSINGSFTINAWIKCSDVTDYRMIISKETPTTGTPWNYRLYLNTGTGRLIADIATGGAVQASGTTNLADGAWHMVTMIRNTSISRLTVYADTTQEGYASDALANIGNAQEAWIGLSAYTQSGQKPNGSYPFKGSIGEVAIYNSALSTSDLTAIYNATKATYGL